MNPLREMLCYVKCTVDEKVYCLFRHSGWGVVQISAKSEKRKNRAGYVRCPEEWEISAVKS